MQFTTTNVNINMTSLQGYITIDYDKLIDVFGKPNMGDEYKIDAEWELEFEDGTVATIYNWKNGKNYLGVEGTPVDDITDWHVGGKTKRAVELVNNLLKL